MIPVEPEAREALAAHLSRLRHDLGKYVSLQVRWLGDDADPASLREALAADLLATRRGPSGTVDALALWAEFRPALFGEAPLPDGPTVDLTGDADLARLDAGMAEIALAIAGLRAGDLDAEGVRRGAGAAARVAEACRALWARARGG